MHLKMLSGKRRPFCLGLNVLTSTHLHNQTQTTTYAQMPHPLMASPIGGPGKFEALSSLPFAAPIRQM